ncbi:hypothetical protein HRR83_005118 [Exophiala dermatitidis]|uniref:Uncharacterized protein n=1 Tax=Exophiala dermatitidis TaxID=5970 RepID=A0AAN6IUQ7_EXODE|nr:hypothetical protein HRR74_004717 [Exophiala dermatitidis]KAJ4519853.1 hypothetical protein HRR73_003914 [Exophiala dermatitidis]KAJ4534338.1 hypothetical protein HRR76_006266 [Exophiala dermatitidis]KAJ4541440.1 hypothetical protein HRR77_006232 [Exophiala dermatitidis]KAJ4564017.1 hypothetical protein HRR79_006044 [Exophiala dermatitidis]
MDNHFGSQFPQLVVLSKLSRSGRSIFLRSLLVSWTSGRFSRTQLMTPLNVSRDNYRSSSGLDQALPPNYAGEQLVETLRPASRRTVQRKRSGGGGGSRDGGVSAGDESAVFIGQEQTTSNTFSPPLPAARCSLDTFVTKRYVQFHPFASSPLFSPTGTRI